MKKILELLIKFYRRFISPLKPPCCKYYPTCSSYALTAVKKHGAVKGSILAIWRILRCSPWSLGGVDHVPEKFHLYTLKGERKRNSENTNTDNNTSLYEVENTEDI